jgi:hypothetical protein
MEWGSANLVSVAANHRSEAQYSDALRGYGQGCGPHHRICFRLKGEDSGTKPRQLASEPTKILQAINPENEDCGCRATHFV